MNCQEFLKALDGAPVPGSGPGEWPSGWADHASSCPECAFALRLERTLRSAPRWTERPRMNQDARALILARASKSTTAWRRAFVLAEDSAITALAGAGVAVAAVLAAPNLWSDVVPQSLRQAMAPYFQPIVESARTLSAPFVPFMHQSWGVALLALAGFVVIFAASLSAKSLSLRGVG